jgi:hypothetical protein
MKKNWIKSGWDFLSGWFYFMIFMVGGASLIYHFLFGEILDTEKMKEILFVSIFTSLVILILNRTFLSQWGNKRKLHDSTTNPSK